MNIRLTEVDHASLEKLAKDRGVTKSEVAQHILRAHFQLEGLELEKRMAFQIFMFMRALIYEELEKLRDDGAQRH